MTSRVGRDLSGTHLAASVVVVTAVACAQALGLFGGGSPSIIAPCPLPFVLLAFGPVTPYGLPLLVAAVVCFWCAPLLRGDGRIPTRTVVLAWLVAVTSLGWFVSAAVQRLNSDGPLYTATMIAASAALGTVTMFTLRRAQREPGIRASALAHGCLFAWFVSYAYPWFGEVP